MSDMMTPDGVRQQAALERAELYGRVPDYNLVGKKIECVVVAHRFPSDPNNITGLNEYDCDPLTPNIGRLKNCVVITSYIGLDDGDETILRVAQLCYDGTPFVLDTSPDQPATPRWKADGDRVVVEFINGSKDRSIITGYLAAPFNRVGSSQAADPDHPRTRTIKHRGTMMQLDGQGNLTVDFGENGDKTDPTNPNKTLKLTIGTCTLTLDNSSGQTDVKIENGSASIEIDSSGNIKATAAAGGNVDVTAGAGGNANVTAGAGGFVQLNSGEIGAEQGVVRAIDIQASTAGPYPIIGAADVGSTTVAAGN